MPTQQQRRLLFSQRCWTYLLGPFFKASTPDQAAPLTSPYTEAGAVGALTVVQPNSVYAVAGGRLTYGTTATQNTDYWSSNTLTRLAGRALLWRQQRTHVADNYPTVGFATSGGNPNGSPEHCLFHTNAPGFALSKSSGSPTVANIQPATVSAGDDWDFALVLRSVGCFVLAKRVTNTIHFVCWVDDTGATSALVCGMTQRGDGGQITAFRVADLGGAWASDYGIATDRKASSANGDTITHVANCLVEHTITAATGVTQELRVRRTDASNGWIVRMSQAGSTIKLIELVAGVETERASTAQTWTNGTQYRVVVICNGTTIKPYVANVAKTGYASASTNQTATTAYVDTAGANLVSWPRTISLPQGV